MTLEDISFQDPQANLDYDDALLKRADAGEGGEVLRFWESSSLFVVLGRTCQEPEDVDSGACRADGIPVLRRSSGGGTVLQGPGCLNFSLVLSKKTHPDLQSIHASYRFILAKIVSPLKELGLDAEFRPVCDLVLAGVERKFSGNAQRRGREFILHHGTVLYDFDLSLVSRYLKLPSRMPDYRQARPHAEFVTNIPLSCAAIKQAIRQGFFSIHP